jgi:hypothetical protein
MEQVPHPRNGEDGTFQETPWSEIPVMDALSALTQREYSHRPPVDVILSIGISENGPLPDREMDSHVDAYPPLREVDSIARVAAEEDGRFGRAGALSDEGMIGGGFQGMSRRKGRDWKGQLLLR